MTREQLELFRRAYDKSVKKCVKGKNKDGKDIAEQSDWVFFDRDLIQSLLDMTDPKAGGLKMYFGQYDKENLDIIPLDRKDREDYIGRMSIAIAAANRTERGIIDVTGENSDPALRSQSSGESVRNLGQLCPPNCNP
ncbi:hypothetical protein C943_02356 [Mariniradius saccharolyticus AK6]|uniref:Uncharacterized protein n=1 Tax=Mariniradius saccharolyticus AK6 TaxID=1239962 RepID=M7X894_9BACT|nr:hypothetical protein [Mariniradius saccharolyticus]EMS31209.1 hypothetical protein C943_02356 [Mariniradius saccharolyticus AK6]